MPRILLLEKCLMIAVGNAASLCNSLAVLLRSAKFLESWRVPMRFRKKLPAFTSSARLEILNVFHSPQPLKILE